MKAAKSKRPAVEKSKGKQKEEPAVNEDVYLVQDEPSSSTDYNDKTNDIRNNSHDPRHDISISGIVDQLKTIPRCLNPLELKKIKRMSNEDEGIYSIHKDLKLQEENIFRGSPEIDLDCRPFHFVKTRLMEHQVYGIAWMQDRERSNVNGGILADEMGLGKTLQMIGLISRDKIGSITLIVVPSIALMQWITEIKIHSPDAFNVCIYHGRSKNIPFKADYDKINILITTYGTVESDFRRKTGILQKLEFKRIVLDEAHIIKDNKSSTTKAIGFLNSEKRWGLTGTPIQNRVSDLFSLVKYLRMDPHSFYFCKKCPCKSLFWLKYNEQAEYKYRGKCLCGHASSSHFSWWNRKIANPIREFGQTDQNSLYFENLHNIINQIILRRTKINLERSLGLPSKVVTIKRCYFSLQELEFYKSLYSSTKSKFTSYSVNGQVLNNYGHIFELLQKMRMAVNHPYLTYRESSLFKDVLICGFCHEEADDPIKSKCNHIFCRKEAEIFLMETNKCPVCRIPITVDLLSEEVLTSNYVLSTENWQSSTKIETVVEMLNSFKTGSKSPKTIIFSQFVNFLEILRWRLERAGFRCVKIYGSMNISQRQQAIDEFNCNSEITVFLISLKAGGVALNLTEAENVIIMDLWWNPAVEDQAMDRIHRIGQYRPIRIYKIVIEDSIESRVLTLQNKKKALFDTAINNDINALQRLSEEDLMFLFC